MSHRGAPDHDDVASSWFPASALPSAERGAVVAEAAAVRLLTPGDIRGLAGRLNVRPSKRLGQNFVIEPGTVRRIAALAALEPQDVVLEVGPGLGSLTLALLEAGPGQVGAWRSIRCWRPSCPGRSPPARRGWRTGWVWSPPTRCTSTTATCPPYRRCWWPTCRTTWRCRCCCTCWPPCRRCGGGWSWSRPRWQTGCAPHRDHGFTVSPR